MKPYRHGDPWQYLFELYDLDWAETIARGRQRAADNAGVANPRIDAARDDIGIHMLGALGEVLAYRTLGLLVDAVYSPSGDSGIDGTWRGRTWSVKTMGPRGRCFILPPTQPSLKADAGLLVQVDEEHTYGEIVAWVKHETFEAYAAPGPIHNGRRLPGRWLSPEHFEPREDLRLARA
jgi:hypothetical protein